MSIFRNFIWCYLTFTPELPKQRGGFKRAHRDYIYTEHSTVKYYFPYSLMWTLWTLWKCFITILKVHWNISRKLHFSGHYEHFAEKYLKKNVPFSRLEVGNGKTLSGHTIRNVTVLTTQATSRCISSTTQISLLRTWNMTFRD